MWKLAEYNHPVGDDKVVVKDVVDDQKATLSTPDQTVLRLWLMSALFSSQLWLSHMWWQWLIAYLEWPWNSFWLKTWTLVCDLKKKSLLLSSCVPKSISLFLIDCRLFSLTRLLGKKKNHAPRGSTAISQLWVSFWLWESLITQRTHQALCRPLYFPLLCFLVSFCLPSSRPAVRMKDTLIYIGAFVCALDTTFSDLSMSLVMKNNHFLFWQCEVNLDTQGRGLRRWWQALKTVVSFALKYL